MFIRILLTAKYKVPGSNSSVTLLKNGDIIDHDEDYAQFLITQNLAEAFEPASDSVEPAELESDESDRGREGETEDDGLKIVTIIETEAEPVDDRTPVGASLEGKIKSKARLKK